MSDILARLSLRKEHLRRPHDMKIASAKQRRIWREKYSSSKVDEKATVNSSVEIKALTLVPQKTEEYVCGWFGSFNIYTDQEGFKLRWTGFFEKIHKSHNGGDREWQVQINEEAQKLQILEETPADLSLGKLCSEHGYSYGWIKDENIIICTMHNFVFLVVSGLKSSSRSSSTSKSRIKGQSSSSRESGKSSDPVTTRSDQSECEESIQTDPEKSVPANRDPANKNEIDKKDPTQGIPEWLQSFTDNLEDLETQVSAHSSVRENSDSKGAVKVMTNRKHSIYIHFTKDRNCDVRLKTKIMEGSCSRIHWDLTNPVKNYHGIIGLLTSSFKNKQNCRASCTKSKRRNVCDTVAIGREWKMVGWFHQIQRLSAKCASIPCRRKTKLRMKKNLWDHS